MSRIDRLKNQIDSLYQAKSTDRSDWADWLYEHHVFVVADYAKDLSKRFGVDNDLAVAAAMLHDVADAVMKRENQQHGEKSLAMARELLEQVGFGSDEIKVVVDDAILFHGCHGDNLPESTEGKIMATADALGHIATDFYNRALEILRNKWSAHEIANWALPKIERDYQKKIFFDDVRSEVTPEYERVKALFMHPPSSPPRSHQQPKGPGT